jgi:cell division septum initiation protein DivIVA
MTLDRTERDRRIASEDITSRGLWTAFWGYSKIDVDELLDCVAASYRGVEDELAESRAEVAALKRAAASTGAPGRARRA